jgi:hypothetical protein
MIGSALEHCNFFPSHLFFPHPPFRSGLCDNDWGI